jgi:glycosyltransferase involved in cell wall biosynthesis
MTVLNVAVLIPAYNAAEYLPELFGRTAAILPKENIFLVDDGSHDETKGISERFGVNVISHRSNFGKGAALQTGFDAILKKKIEAIVTMDADLQHQPEDIPRFMEMFDRTKCDVIIGNRLHNKKGMPVHRMLSNTITTGLVRIRTGAAIEDSQSGFRFITRSVLERIKLQATGFEAETEFLIKASSFGASFGSIPIETIYAGEKSNMTHLQTTINFIKILLKRY